MVILVQIELFISIGIDVYVGVLYVADGKDGLVYIAGSAKEPEAILGVLKLNGVKR